MRALVTGSSGWLGRTLVPRLLADGHAVVGLDPVPGATTTVVGSVAERDSVQTAIRDHAIDAVVHAGALHKPDIARRSRSEFLAVNVEGTLNLLEEAVAHGVDRFVFTSTTSLMISREIRAGRAGCARQATWITEALAPLLPRNIYGVTKLAAEHLCRLVHQEQVLPVAVLRTSRFFPEQDDGAYAVRLPEVNIKTNELLFRRLTVEDAAEAHVVALAKAPEIGYDEFIVSAMPPFHPDECGELIADAPAVVARHIPEYAAIHARLGWSMLPSIDRVYDPTRAAHRLGFVCRTGFAERLAELATAVPTP